MFKLNQTLKSDTIEVGDLVLCKILLMNDSQYPWIILVPMIEGVTEVYHLPEQQQKQLMIESNYLLKSMAETFNSDKMNVAALGNLVSQLHIHHIARFRTDLAWPAPVWGVAEAKPYTQKELGVVLPQLDSIIENFKR